MITGYARNGNAVEKYISGGARARASVLRRNFWHQCVCRADRVFREKPTPATRQPLKDARSGRGGERSGGKGSGEIKNKKEKMPNVYTSACITRWTNRAPALQDSHREIPALAITFAEHFPYIPTGYTYARVIYDRKCKTSLSSPRFPLIRRSRTPRSVIAIFRRFFFFPSEKKHFAFGDIFRKTKFETRVFYTCSALFNPHIYLFIYCSL